MKPKLNNFYVRSLRKLPEITWTTQNPDVMFRCGLPKTFTVLRIVDCIGWNMSYEWKTEELPKITCTEISSLVCAILDTPATLLVHEAAENENWEELVTDRSTCVEK